MHFDRCDAHRDEEPDKQKVILYRIKHFVGKLRSFICLIPLERSWIKIHMLIHIFSIGVEHNF